MKNIIKNNPLYVVDIGASGGIDPRWKGTGLSYKGILFEPDPREYEVLKNSSDSNLIVLNSALSDCIKEIDFHLCNKQMVSSVYAPNFDFLNRFPDSERFGIFKKIKMNTDTLSNQLKKNSIDEVDFVESNA